MSRVEEYRPGKSQEELVEASLDNPIGSLKLEELVKGKKNIVIISSDHTRPVPSKIITPILLRRIRSSQPDANIKILRALNCSFSPFPSMSIESVGYGAGSREFAGRPSVVRISVGELTNNAKIGSHAFQPGPVLDRSEASQVV